jgi:MSHA biogenesis protein MshO
MRTVVNDNTGFTLIELVIVILIMGVLSFILVNILRGPMQAYLDVERRARLVDIAETALQRMTREIRLALPNSVRLSGSTAIEFLRTRDGGRYRNKGANRLKFNKQSDTFQFLGPLNNFATILTGGASQADCLIAPRTADCMVVYNAGNPGANAYAGENIAAITAKNFGASTLSFDLTPVTNFPIQSPSQRFQVVDTPVSFVCSGASITRYSDYSITVGQAVPPLGGNSNLLVEQVSVCSMTYDPGSATRAALVTISITLQDTNLGQSVTLLQQAHVPNQP